MNHLLIGTADKTKQLIAWAEKPFIIIDDGRIADAFLSHFPNAKLFDVSRDTFNPLRNIDYKRARDFATTIYTASPEGRETLTVRNGKRALIKLLLRAKRLDDLPTANITDPAIAEALATIEDLLLSPVLKNVLCNAPNFSFKGMVVAKIDRAVIGDFDAFLLASLLIAQAQGQIIVPDFGFYGRELHTSLLRQEKLTAGVNFLAELPPKLRNALLLIENKVGAHCTPEDAETLAQFVGGLRPGTDGHSTFIDERIS